MRFYLDAQSFPISHFEREIQKEEGFSMQNAQESFESFLRENRKIGFMFQEEFQNSQMVNPETRPYNIFYPEKPWLARFNISSPLKIQPQKIDFRWIATSTGTQILYKALTQSYPKVTEIDDQTVRVLFDTRNPNNDKMAWTLDLHGKEDQCWTYRGITLDSLFMRLERNSILTYNLDCKGEYFTPYSKQKLEDYNERSGYPSPKPVAELPFYSYQTRILINDEVVPVIHLDLKINDLQDTRKIQISGEFFCFNDDLNKKDGTKESIESFKIDAQNLEAEKLAYRVNFIFGSGTLNFGEIRQKEYGTKIIPFTIDFDENDFQIEADYHKEDWLKAAV